MAAIERIGRIGERTGLGDPCCSPLLDLLTLDIVKFNLIAGIEEQRALFAVDERTGSDIHHRLLVAVAGELKSDELLAGIFKRRIESIRPFIVIVRTAEKHSRAALHFLRIVDTKRPASCVGEVRSVVAALGSTPIAEPVPVVVDDVVAVFAARSRALPKFPIEPLRDCGRLAAANRSTIRHIPALAPLEFPDNSARTDVINRLLVRERSAALVAHLEYHARLVPGVDENLAFTRAEAARLLDIDGLARTHSEHRRIGMPVIGRNGNDAVNRLILENLAQILLLARLIAGSLLDLRSSEIERTRIYIAHPGNLNARHLQRRTQNLGTTTLGVATDHCEAHTVGRRIHAEGLACRSDEKCAGTCFDEISSVHDKCPR